MNSEIARWDWIPAFAGMTDRQCSLLLDALNVISTQASASSPKGSGGETEKST